MTRQACTEAREEKNRRRRPPAFAGSGPQADNSTKIPVMTGSVFALPLFRGHSRLRHYEHSCSYTGKGEASQGFTRIQDADNADRSRTNAASSLSLPVVLSMARIRRSSGRGSVVWFPYSWRVRRETMECKAGRRAVALRCPVRCRSVADVKCGKVSPSAACWARTDKSLEVFSCDGIGQEL